MLLDRRAQRQEGEVALRREQRRVQERGGRDEEEPAGRGRLLGQREEPEQAAQDQHVALGEVQDAARAVDHVEADGHERVDRAQADAADQDDDELIHGASSAGHAPGAQHSTRSSSPPLRWRSG